MYLHVNNLTGAPLTYCISKNHSLEYKVLDDMAARQSIDSSTV